MEDWYVQLEHGPDWFVPVLHEQELSRFESNTIRNSQLWRNGWKIEENLLLNDEEEEEEIEVEGVLEDEA